MSNLTIDLNQPPAQPPVVIHTAEAQASATKVEGVVISLPPAVVMGAPELSASLREAAPVKNNRDSGHKYFEAIKGLKYALADYKVMHGTDCIDDLCEVNPNNPEEARFQLDLLNATKEIAVSDLNLRDRNTKIILHLREAALSPFYQRNKGSDNRFCRLLQALCSAKFTEVYPHESFKELVTNAARSAGRRGDAAVDMLKANSISLNKATVGGIVRQFNATLKDASSEYTKDWVSQYKGKLQGKVGVHDDPLLNSNVPWLRSKFTIDEGDDGIERSVACLRLGTPTIQEVHRYGNKTTRIDPMFLAFLDGLDGNFLYVNHQRLRKSKEEATRANAIKEIDQAQYPKFRFMSIPLDGPITDAIREGRSIGAFKALVKSSFNLGINGCILPKPGLALQTLDQLLDHTHEDWFAGKVTFNREELEAFWGVFQTGLKHAVITMEDITATCSTCKDNVDRGNTLATIDEAVRNVLIGKHEVQGELRQLGFNVLLPFVVKLEPILDGDGQDNKKHHRLGFFVSVMNHIAKLNQQQVQAIQSAHNELLFRVTQQDLAPQRTSRPLVEWIPFGVYPEASEQLAVVADPVAPPAPVAGPVAPPKRKVEHDGIFEEVSPGWWKRVGKLPEHLVPGPGVKPNRMLEGDNILEEIEPGEWGVIWTLSSQAREEGKRD